MTFMEPLDWVKKYINKDMGFYGIKMYPAYGFFPFDARLDPVYEWAAEKEIPIMTHCTRGGSWYLGTFDSVLNKGGFMAPGLNEDHPSMTNIRGRINSLIADKDKHKNNKYWCNIFGHIENYEPVLAKYPNLKICFAHMGGATEILRPDDDKSFPDYFNHNWYKMIKDKLANHKNTYTDISYTLSNEMAMAKIKSDYVDKDFLKYKVLYGTDFFLTQVEKKGDEPNMLSTFLQLFDQASIQKIAYDNNENYLKSMIHPTP
jgi:predicted TIM-barrel fold metal-dependent hydrolase